ncbi:MAG: hypothetical protein QOA14_01510 [Nitrososphaeraceae archaeon]|nr:hypothetical protein [Nitrososphaeraceae archaeon]MDW0183808.1 hypothetical protein [Nitrososphaeraceae archaeon]MDW0200338.1 hypothetical protein [Nitrososphaeraceae archaeon]MDW0210752.1 hypothetical protein [Nitrososphaeraceae archaeon]MDW0220264.1 hypothetical protein [Nitrososphaeraceae archaeon]
MDKPLTEHFLYELKNQCNFAIQGYNDFVSAYNNRSSDRMWSSLELFLIAAAKISIIFWTSDPKYAKRGEELRKHLSVNDTVAFKTRAPRNHLEHFDERLDDWYVSYSHHNLMDRVVFPETTFATGNFDYLRAFFTRRFVFRFLNNEYEIKPISDSIVELLSKVDKALSNLQSRTP